MISSGILSSRGRRFVVEDYVPPRLYSSSESLVCCLKEFESAVWLVGD